MVTYKRVETTFELKQILELQQRNLFTNLTDEERLQEGFVTVSHTLDILMKMNAVCPHIIARDEDKVVGYALCMHPRFSEEIDILKPMFLEIKKIYPKTEKFIVMGQICIDKAYRGKSVFRMLYETMKQKTSNEYDTIITEVDAKNQRSLNAHYAIGFKHLKTHNSNGSSWELIVLK